MKKRSAYFFSISLMASLAACGQNSFNDSDPAALRLPEDCSFREGIKLCAASLTKLIVHPSEYDGSSLTTEGFLAISGGYFMLYPRRSDYVDGLSYDRIMVAVPNEKIDNFCEEFCYSYIMVKGEFRDASISGKYIPYRGEISNVSNVWKIDPPKEKEQASDVFRH